MTHNKTKQIKPTGNKFLDIALYRASQGQPVFPLKTKDKSPLTTHGFKDATTDIAQIKQWWEKWPNANIGMPTGKISGVWVFDVDANKKKNKVGIESLAKLEKEYGKLPETYTVRTGTKGLHYYFLDEPDSPTIPSTASSLGKDLDVRGNGGYIVLAGSVTEDEYRVEGMARHYAKAPDWLVALVNKKHTPNPEEPWEELDVVEGERNTKLLSLAGVARQKGLGYDAILDLLQSTNKHHVDDPLPENELIAIAKSVCKYTPGAQEHDETDVGNALRLVTMFGEDLIYCPSYKKWFTWNGKFWEEDSTGEAMRKAMAMVAACESEFKPGHKKRSKQPAGLRAMLEIARHIDGMYILPKDLDSHHWLLNLNNGTLDLRSRELHQHNKKDFLTKMLDIEYLPDAECHLFRKCISEIMCEDEEKIFFIQRLAGYFLTGETKESKFFFFLGDGANGKSTLIAIIHMVLGYMAITAQPSTFIYRRSERIRNDLAALVGARFVSAVEIDPQDRLDEPLMKQLTGGDIITVRKLFNEPFEYKPTFKIVLGVNRLPAITGTDRGIWRRVCVIPFNATFEEAQQDKDLLEKLKHEKSGILNWMLEGLSEWRKQGLNPPACVLEASKEYMQKMDTIERFILEECEIGQQYMVRSNFFNTAYEKWCREYGYYPLNRQETLKTMGAKGFPREKRQGGYLNFVGITLKEHIIEDKEL